MRADYDPAGADEWPECIGGPFDGDRYCSAWPQFVVTKRLSRILLDSESRLTRNADAELAGAYLLNFSARPWRFTWHRFEPDESQADGVK